uniref:Uncharacterized protein n=1 Tax=Arundo donax TaxID=35708 RepID=A0A0A8YNN1_ARUDO
MPSPTYIIPSRPSCSPSGVSLPALDILSEAFHRTFGGRHPGDR